MTPDEINAILEVWGAIYTKNLQKALKDQLYTFAPGFKQNAYSKGRNQEYAGQANKIASGSLYKSIRYDVNNQLLQIYMAPHWKYVNYGVEAKGFKKGLKRGRGGKSEFISSLVQWSKVRLGMSGDNALSMAFAVRTNIFKFGIAPTNFQERGLQAASAEARRVLPGEIIKYLKDNFGI
jgi:hypothetical protein